MIGQREPIGGDAQLDIGDLLGNQGERRLGLLPVVAGIAGAGDAEDRELRHLVGDGDDLAQRLLRRELFRDDAGTAFVGAIVFAVAVMALDVAGGRDRNVHAGEVVMRLFRVAGVVLDAVPNFRRQIGCAGIRTAGRGRRTARRLQRFAHRICGSRAEQIVERDKVRHRKISGTASAFRHPPFQAACQKLTTGF